MLRYWHALSITPALVHTGVEHMACEHDPAGSKSQCWARLGKALAPAAELLLRPWAPESKAKAAAPPHR